MKKKLKIIGISILTIILLLFVIPLLFQSQIKDAVKTFINNNVNAKVEFSDVNLSLLRHFPKASIAVKDLVIINNKPFEGDTLAVVKSLAFKASITELFKNPSDDAIEVNAIYVDEALVNIKANKNGDANYDIAKQTKETTENDSESKGFRFNIKNYNISDSGFTFLDDVSDLKMHITALNHKGSGSFSNKNSELDTETEANISFSIDSTSYLNNTSIKLDAIIGMDLENNTYTFKDNKGFINQLPLEFKGYITQLEDGQDIDINFKNPESSFKDFLGIIPEAYSKNINEVETNGDFIVNGIIKGISSNSSIPKLDINIVSNNASFKYPNLPKRVENIKINTSIKNTTGQAEDTFIDINTFNFKIDDDVFKISGVLKNLTTNMLVNGNVDGTLNLENLTKAYPIDLDKDLQGILKGKLNTRFDMDAVENNAYSRISNKGFMHVSDFVYSSQDIVNPIHIANANINFNPGTVKLTSFDAKTGESDFKATGTINNLLGFLLSDKKLQGQFNVTSNYFAVSDFMVEDETTPSNNKTTSDEESLKIPAFLDCTINAKAAKVLYDNITLNNVNGVLLIKDEQATLQNMTTNLFDGKMTMTGNINTKNKTPNFNLNLGVAGFDIAQSFNKFETFQTLAPIAKAIQGKLNTTINLQGKLDEAFSPDINSISGDAFAELLSSTISPANAKVLSELGGALQFVDFTKLNLDDLKANLEFKDGRVKIKPFKVAYQDIDIEISGSHNFTNIMDYNAVFHVPAKYLGSDVNKLISKIDDDAINTLTIPVTANITGSYNKPKVKTDLSSSVTKLTQQLVELQKQKLLNKGKDKIYDVLGDILGHTDKNKDSTNNNNDPVKDVLGGILGGNNKQSDTTKTTEDDVVNDVLGGLLGKKKKKKDSTKN